MTMHASHQRLTDFGGAWRWIPLLFLVAGTAYAENETHYQLAVGIEPATHQLKVGAVVELPPEFAGRSVEFLLTSALQIHDSDPGVERLPYEARWLYRHQWLQRGIGGTRRDRALPGHAG